MSFPGSPTLNPDDRMEGEVAFIQNRALVLFDLRFSKLLLWRQKVSESLDPAMYSMQVSYIHEKF